MIGDRLTKQRQHLIVRRVIWNEESKVRIAQNGRDSDQTCAASWHNADVLPCVLALLPLAVVNIVQVGDGFS